MSDEDREAAEQVMYGHVQVPSFVMSEGMYAQFLLLRDISDQLRILNEGKS